MRAGFPIALIIVCGSLSAVGCIEEQRYVVERERVRMPATAEAAFVDENDNAVFIVSRRFSLPLRPPPELVLQQLREGAQGRMLPFPRLPWIGHQDLEIKVDYVLENRSEQAVSALVFLDGINEFHAYTPGPADFHQYERRFRVDPGERVSGTIRELQMEEVAIDLATAVNGAPNTALVVHSESQSTRDPRVQGFIPEVIPGLIAFRMGIQTEADGDEAPAPELVLRLSARAQDHGNRLAERGDSSWDLPTPQNFVPVTPEEEP